MNVLFEFVGSQRDRFEVQHSNVFAFSWSKITRRLAFLDIIERKYLEASEAFIANSEACQSLIKPGDHLVGPELAALQEEGIGLSAELHLQIESYYLFAKIVLDDVARAIEYYFGTARGLPLNSHDDLAKNLDQYATAKALGVDAELTAAIADLKHRISDVRDYKISHEKSPRTMTGTMWDRDNRLARIAMMRLYPRATDPEQFETEPLPALRQAIHDYLDRVINFVTNNETKTTLKTLDDAGPETEPSSNQIHGPGWHLSAVFGPDSQLQLWDIFINNEWVGSKRTEKQCYEVIRNAGLPSNARG